MEKKKEEMLESAGWTVGSVEKLLALTPEESAIIELRLRLSTALRNRRRELGWSQGRFADLLRSSQSRVAKMEGDDPSVSLDLLIRGLVASGVGLDGLAQIVDSGNKRLRKPRMVSIK